MKMKIIIMKWNDKWNNNENDINDNNNNNNENIMIMK